MSTIAYPQACGRGLPLRFALREMRGGLRGFYVFITTIALGSMAIAGVGSLSASLASGLARQGQVILGGDLSFTLVQHEVTPEERAFLDRHGKVSSAATMRAMARTADGKAALVEMKAIDGAYPLFGRAELDPPGGLAGALARRNGVFGAVADPVLLTRLGIKQGARLTIGNAAFEIRAALASEPDKLAGGIGFGPRLMVSEAALRATGLLQPGSLVRWHYRLRLPANDSSDAAAKAVTAQARTAFPEAGWDIRSRSNASPQLERNVERFTQFLAIVGLTALLVGGVGVGNAVKSHLDRRRETIATLKALGASGRRIFAIYLIQVLMLAAIGGTIGMVLGATLPYLIAWTFGTVIPLPIEPALHPAELILALIYGLTTALAFALWPLGRAHDVPVGALFRDTVAPQPRWPRKTYLVLTALAVLALTALAIALAYDRRVAIIYVGIAAGVFVTLRLVAALLMLAAHHTPRARSTVLRMAVANIHRPGALTATIVLSLGLGIALLVTVIEIDGNLQRQFSNELPAKAPSFYFLDIPADQATRFDAFVRAQAPSAKLEEVPMLAAASSPPTASRPSRSSRKRARPGCCKATAALRMQARSPPARGWSRVSGGNRITTAPRCSRSKRRSPTASVLSSATRSTSTCSAATSSSRIANMRTVNWESLGINFVMVFSPHAFDGAPRTHLATLTYADGGTPGQEGAIIRAVAETFPMVTVLRVKDALDAIGSIVANLVLAIRGASALTLVIAALVLGGALAAGHRHRVYDAVILKTLGATRLGLLAAYTIEYLLLGTATALFACSPARLPAG